MKTYNITLTKKGKLTIKENGNVIFTGNAAKHAEDMCSGSDDYFEAVWDFIGGNTDIAHEDIDWLVEQLLDNGKAKHQMDVDVD